MVSVISHRYAVIATGHGGVVLEDRYFADRLEADRAQREIREGFSQAHRVLVIDRVSGAMLAELPGRGADSV